MPQELKAIPRDGVSRIDEYLGELVTMKPYPTPDYRRGERLHRKPDMYSLDEMKQDFSRSFPPAMGAISYADLLRLLADAPPYQTQHQPRVEMGYTELAALVGNAITACGYGDTLTWCTEMWGTKWGSFRCAIDEATMPAWKSAVIIDEWPDRKTTSFLCADANWHYYQCLRTGRILAKHR